MSMKKKKKKMMNEQQPTISNVCYRKESIGYTRRSVLVFVVYVL